MKKPCDLAMIRDGHRKRSPKEVWRLVDAGGSDSSTADSKANPVSKLATRTSDAR